MIHVPGGNGIRVISYTIPLKKSCPYVYGRNIWCLSTMFSMYIPLLRLSMSNVAHKILASVFSFISSPYLLLLLSIAELNNLK